MDRRTLPLDTGPSTADLPGRFTIDPRFPLRRHSPSLLPALLLATGLVIALPAATPRAAVSYADDVAPIFERSCISCHGGTVDGELRIEAGLDLTSYDNLMMGSEFGEVLTPGDPDGSMLVDMIAVGDMPEEGDPLTQEETELISTWVAEGAKNN